MQIVLTFHCIPIHSIALPAVVVTTFQGKSFADSVVDHKKICLAYLLRTNFS